MSITHTPPLNPADRVASEDPLLRLTINQPVPSTTLVTVVGEVDAATAPRLADALRPPLGAGETVLVDLNGVAFLGAAGLNVLADAHRRALGTGGTLTLIIGTHYVRRILTITGLATELACLETIRESTQEIPA